LNTFREVRSSALAGEVHWIAIAAPASPHHPQIEKLLIAARNASAINAAITQNSI
jgi:hypothetical protein